MVIHFLDEIRGTVALPLVARVALPTETHLRGVPSLLGRDVIGEFVLVVNEADSFVSLDLPLRRVLA